MITPDPLSLLFIGSFIIGLIFLLVLSFTGHGHGHSVHHVGTGSHVGHAGHGPVSHGTHAHTPTGNGQSTQGNHFSFLAVINPMSIVLFLIGFGLLGYILHTATPFSFSFLVVFSALGGLVLAGVLIMFLNRLFSTEIGNVVQDVADRTGLVGKVNMTIPQQGMGEIIYVSPGGMRKSVPARSVDGRRLERDQEIVVLSYKAGVAEVDTWEHFVAQATSDSGLSPDGMAAAQTMLDDAN